MAKKKAPTNGEDENSNPNPTYDLNDLPGVGEVTLKKLKSSGIISIRLLAMYPLSSLMEDAGIGEKTAKKLIKAAQDIEQMGFTSADTIWEKRKLMRRISTGGQNLDDLLGGGL